jgi:hypothetical protein
MLSRLGQGGNRVAIGTPAWRLLINATSELEDRSSEATWAAVHFTNRTKPLASYSVKIIPNGATSSAV